RRVPSPPLSSHSYPSVTSPLPLSSLSSLVLPLSLAVAGGPAVPPLTPPFASHCSEERRRGEVRRQRLGVDPRRAAGEQRRRWDPVAARGAAAAAVAHGHDAGAEERRPGSSSERGSGRPRGCGGAARSERGRVRQAQIREAVAAMLTVSREFPSPSPRPRCRRVRCCRSLISPSLSRSGQYKDTSWSCWCPYANGPLQAVHHDTK
ncbi:unnamed protein product, partial [Urochloa humidicola]